MSSRPFRPFRSGGHLLGRDERGGDGVAVELAAMQRLARARRARQVDETDETLALGQRWRYRGGGVEAAVGVLVGRVACGSCTFSTLLALTAAVRTRWRRQVFSTSLAMMMTPFAAFVLFGLKPSLALLLGVAISCTAVHVRSAPLRAPPARSYSSFLAWCAPLGFRRERA